MLENKNNSAPERTEKLPENVKILDLPDARYRIIYEIHTLSHSPEEVGTPDAYVSQLMVPFDYSDPSGAQQAIDYRWKRYYDRRSQDPARTAKDSTDAFKKHLESHRIPFYLVDLIEPEKNAMQPLEDKAMLLAVAETGLGAAALGYAGTKAIAGLSRRDMLKMTGAGVLAAKGALQAAAYTVSSDAGKHTQLSDTGKKIIKLHEILNPETAALFLSYGNAIWSHKLHEIAKDLKEKIGRRPEIDFQTGYPHAGIENMLGADPAQRLAYIRNASYVLNKFFPVGEKGVKISPIARFEFSEQRNRWSPTETKRDAQLEQIEKSL